MAIHTKGFALVMKMFLKAIGFDRVEDQEITQFQIFETTQKSERILVGWNGWVSAMSPGQVSPDHWP